MRGSRPQYFNLFLYLNRLNIFSILKHSIRVKPKISKARLHIKNILKMDRLRGCSIYDKRATLVNNIPTSDKNILRSNTIYNIVLGKKYS